MSEIVQTSNPQHTSYIYGQNRLSDVKEEYVSYIDDELEFSKTSQ